MSGRDRPVRPGEGDDRVLPAAPRGRNAALLLICGVAVACWGARMLYAGPAFWFLAWNLALAAVPWIAAWGFAKTRSRVARGLSAAVWLLFLPNAPYLVTDLVHLRARPPVPVWFDVMLLASFALAGCALGWASLELVHRRLARSLGPRWSAVAIGAAILLTGFGVYLGRFDRWNSWDAVTRPGAVIARSAGALHSPRAIVFSALFAAFVGAGYLFFTWRDTGDERRA